MCDDRRGQSTIVAAADTAELIAVGCLRVVMIQHMHLRQYFSVRLT